MAKILVVENEDHYRQSLRRHFEENVQWTVYEARNADEALAAIQRVELDGIILDRRMPIEIGGKDEAYTGDQVMNWLFDHALLSDICVIMITAYGEVRNASEALSMGVWQYLQKPQLPREIYRLLAPGIAMKRCNRLRRQVAADGGTQSTVNGIREVIQQTLAPDLFTVYLLTGEIDAEDSRRRFVHEIRNGKPFLYLGTRSGVKDYDPVLSDAGTLMAVRIVARENEAYGVVVMESRREGAFDPRWQEVLRYFADLVGLSVTVCQAREEKVKAERQAREASEREVESLRHVNRELRHRLSNSIGTMYQYNTAILAELKDPGLRSKAEVCRKHLDSFVEVMKELRDATNPVEVAPPQPCNAKDVTTETLSEQLDDFAKAGVVVGFGEADQSVTVLADRQKLEYCLRCVLQNALEAVLEGRAWARPDPAEPKVAVADEELDAIIAAALSKSSQKRLDVSIEIRAVHDMGEILVRDQGIGFDDEIKQRLFTPLFTTKVTRERNSPNDGMGLFSVRRLVEKMGGVIAAHSDGPRRGASFAIRLPLVIKA